MGRDITLRDEAWRLLSALAEEDGKQVQVLLEELINAEDRDRHVREESRSGDMRERCLRRQCKEKKKSDFPQSDTD